MNPSHAHSVQSCLMLVNSEAPICQIIGSFSADRAEWYEDLLGCLVAINIDGI
jgi:hypothetical protein